MSGPPTWKDQLAEREAEARLAATRARPAAPPAPPISRAMRAALKPVMKDAAPSLAALEDRWTEMVGPRLGAITRPAKVTTAKGMTTLTVRAPSAAAPLIQHAAEAILARVSLAIGKTVETLKIEQTKVAAPIAGAPAGRRPRVLSAAEREAIAHDLDQVKTPAVRDALKALGEAVLAWPEQDTPAAAAKPRSR